MSAVVSGHRSRSARDQRLPSDFDLLSGPSRVMNCADLGQLPGKENRTMTMTNPEEPTAGSTTKDSEPKETRRTVKKKRSSPRSKPTQGSVRAGTKAAKVLSLLRRPGGASLQELCKATGWQAHSVRGFLSGGLKKKLGYALSSIRRKTGERVYLVKSK